MAKSIYSNKVLNKLKSIPKSCGVYLFRNKNQEIIYVGKAVNLRNRVNSYFIGAKNPKIQQLLRDISDLEWVQTISEVGALILESEFIKRYKPRYNTELKDNKNFLYLKIPNEDFPMPLLVRNPDDDKARYLGPFTDAGALKRILKILRKVFPWRSKGDLKAKRPCFYFYLGQCPGVCLGKVSKREYQKNIRGIISFFKGGNEKLMRAFEKEMKKAAKDKEFEKAAVFRDKIIDLNKINSLRVLKDEDFEKEDTAIQRLKEVLKLKGPLKRIEGYDISHLGGCEAVGSMVVLENGIFKKEGYRRFKIKTVEGIDDVAMMKEILRRRFKRAYQDYFKNRGESDFLMEAKDWGELPDLLVIDGGKGQLGTTLDILETYNLQIPAIALAKKNEEIITCKCLEPGGKREFRKIILQKDNEALYLLQRIRDEAHRFAITYFRNLHEKYSKKSSLDLILGVGPKTKGKLIEQFGSLENIKKAGFKKLKEIVGEKLAQEILKHL